MKSTIYLFFKGTCLEAMTHYAQTLGGSIDFVFRNGDAPDPAHRMPGGDDLVMNMVITIDGARIMASDTPDAMYAPPRGVRVQLAPTTRADFDRVFDALGRDAKAIEMAPAETFWAERFTMFTDRFGTPWMLNFEGNKTAG